MQRPSSPAFDPVTACRQHVERVRRHGRLTVALIERVRISLRRRAAARIQPRGLERHLPRH